MVAQSAPGPSRIARPSLVRTSSSTTSTPATTTPSVFPPTTRRYKAPLSPENPSRVRTTSVSYGQSAPAPTFSIAPPGRKRTSSLLTPNLNVNLKTTPKKEGSSRPRTPVSPGRKAESPVPFASEMDVSNVNPEDVLVDFQSVEMGDLSTELEEEGEAGGELGISSLSRQFGRQDKVMVSIRIRPTEGQSAWIASPATGNIKLDPVYARQSSTSTISAAASSSFNFDAILTGTPNKPIYTTVARSHVYAAMEGYNAVIFAYGQTASGKTFTLSGDEDEPGIIPRAMKDVFASIKRTPTREYLLRCSYLEIYNETIVDLLAPPSIAASNPVQIQGMGVVGNDVVLAPLREEVVTSLKSVKDVLKRGEGNRRTACTDWNERSSRSHSVFRLVVESRQRDPDGNKDNGKEEDEEGGPLLASGRQTPNGRVTPGGRRTPGASGRQTPGGSRLQARGGRSVQTSVLSLIDLAGSEKATSDKDRTREGKYINTSLLTLGTVIGTLADNASKKKSDHVPFRNSKLTRMLQPSLSGNARISVICTINPDVNYIGESTSTLLFAKRIKNVQLNAQKKEILDTDALIERYRKEIEELKKRLAEREAEAPVRRRRLSVREQMDESMAMRDLNARIQQLTKLILTSQTVEETKESRPASPVKIDFDMSPYQLHQELLSAKMQIESQASQILSLEAALMNKPPPEPVEVTESEDEKDQLITEQQRRIRELEEKMRYGGQSGERELEEQLESEIRKREEKERWADELIRELEREKRIRTRLEDERRALAAFVSKFDSLSFSSPPSSTTSKLQPPLPTPGGAAAAFAERQQQRTQFGNGIGLSKASSLPPIPPTPSNENRQISRSFSASIATASPRRNQTPTIPTIGPPLLASPPASPPPMSSTMLYAASSSTPNAKSKSASHLGPRLDIDLELTPSPFKFSLEDMSDQSNLLDQQLIIEEEEEWGMTDGDVSFGELISNFPDAPRGEVVMQTPRPPLMERIESGEMMGKGHEGFDGKSVISASPEWQDASLLEKENVPLSP
ncbi:hypothetical protein AX16_001533 [Volvariella volvacea WC 439]|nr:hypothetical protein AX16_001533 [Volvariella volvacea WC 439]